MLGDRRVGPGDQDAVAGDVRARGPNLLTVHHPLVAVTFGPGLQPCQVGAGPGLGEQLAPDLTRYDPRQEAGLLLRGGVGDDGGAGQVLGDSGRRRSHSGITTGVGDHAAGVTGQPTAVELDGPGREAPPGVCQALPPLPQRQIRIPALLEPCPGLGIDATDTVRLTLIRHVLYSVTSEPLARRPRSRGDGPALAPLTP